MKERIPIVVQIHQQRCVVLYLRVPNVGGSPVYCYRLDKDVLIDAAEDFE